MPLGTKNNAHQDDVTGVPAEHPHVMAKINMTTAQLAELRAATTATHARLVDELIKAGKYNWQAFSNGDGAGGGIIKTTCHKFMQGRCNAEYQNQPMMMGAGAADNQSVAAFLITR